MKHVIFSKVFPIAGLAESKLAVSWIVSRENEERTFKCVVWSYDTIFSYKSWPAESIQGISIEQSRRIADTLRNVACEIKHSNNRFRSQTNISTVTS